MKNNLKQLTKTELLKIISKMKKNDLIQMIGGSDNATRTAIIYNKEKNNKKEIIAMANNSIYNNI
jgi:hypothetical protein